MLLNAESFQWLLFSQSEVWSELGHPALCELHTLFLLLPRGSFLPTVGILPGFTGSQSVHAQVSPQPKPPQIAQHRILELPLSKAPLFPVPYSANSKCLCSLELWYLLVTKRYQYHALVQPHSQEDPPDRKPDDHSAQLICFPSQRFQSLTAYCPVS